MKFSLNRIFASASSEVELLKSLNRHYDIAHESGIGGFLKKPPLI